MFHGNTPCRKIKQLRSTAASSASGGYAIPHEPADAGLQQSRPDSAAGGEEDAAGKVGFSGALMNVLNILSGVGLLSVPYALRKAGWVGLGVLWLLGIVTNYTGPSPIFAGLLSAATECTALFLPLNMPLAIVAACIGLLSLLSWTRRLHLKSRQ